MPTKTVSVGITLGGDGSLSSSLNPRRVVVENGADVVLEWTIPPGAGQFHETNPFTWNTSATSPAPPTVTRVSNTKLQSSSYVNSVTGDTPLTWAYTVRVVNGLAHVTIDPVVDNEPPG